jgi:glycosyltransferase involved in cell wall biosynthesis
MAAYNHQPFVAKAVSTILEQTFEDLELIVVDDGSSDATPDIVASIKDARIKLVRLAINRAVHPRNLALSHARGRYIAFQNSDDEWLPTKLALQIPAMEKDPGLSACFTAATLIDETGHSTSGTWADRLFATEEQPQAQWLRRFFDHGNCLPLTSAVARRAQVAAVGGFRASLVQLGDFDLWVRLAALGRFRLLPETLIRIRILAHANFSAPNPASKRRSQFEHAMVLERYLEKPLLDMFDKVFGDISQAQSAGARQVAIAQYALSKHGGIGALFADRAIAGVLENPTARAEAVAEHGNDFIHEFLTRRGQWAFVRQDNREC